MSHLILSLDEAGTPQGWLTYKKGLAQYAKGHIKWHLGDEFVYQGGISRMTGIQTSIGIPSIVAIRNIYRGQRMVPNLNNENLFGRDLDMCAYCGETYHRSKLTRDHIHPVSRGGPNTWMNCVTACKGCNGRKADYLLSEIGMSLIYVPYVPNRFESLVLHNRNILADQSQFLKALMPKGSRLLQ